MSYRTEGKFSRELVWWSVFVAAKYFYTCIYSATSKNGLHLLQNLHNTDKMVPDHSLHFTEHSNLCTAGTSLLQKINIEVMSQWTTNFPQLIGIRVENYLKTLAIFYPFSLLKEHSCMLSF